MKKFILVPLVFIALLFPAFSHAQTVSQADLQQQYITLLQQYITILQQQIAHLQELQAGSLSVNTTNSVVSTGTESDDNVVTAPKVVEPTATVTYDSNTGYLAYNGTYEIKSGNVWFSYRASKSAQQSWNKTGASIVDQVKNGDTYTAHLSLNPGVKSQLHDNSNTVLMVQLRFPDESFFTGTSLEFDASGNLMPYINGD